MAGETAEQRRQREARRVLFDGVAGRYDATRQGYPDDVVDTMLATAGARPASSVLEVGCGTGQLTRQLAVRGLRITAVDIGPAMIDAARRNVAEENVSFAVSSFEDYKAAGPYDLVVSATAFHWVDPEVGWAKAARLLQPAGWLALLSTGERYHEPLRSAVRELWVKYNPDNAEWTPRAPWARTLQESDLFGPVVDAAHEQPLTLPAASVLGVETTRATYLSYDEASRRSFAADLGRMLDATPTVELIQETYLAMAPVARQESTT